MSAFRFMKTAIILTFLFSFVSIVCGQEEEEPARAWTNKEGRTIVAQFVEADGETVTISIKGQRHVLKLADLSERSQRLAAELKGVSEPEPKPEPETPPAEIPAEENLLEQEHQWKNVAGKEIVAKYELREQNQVIVACGDRLQIVFSFEETNRKGSLGAGSSDPSDNMRLLATLENNGLYGGWEEDALGRPVPTIFRGEEILLQAIRKVSRETTSARKAYFLIGHGEMNLSSWNETRGLSEMKNFFDGLDLESKEFMLGSGQSVPEDANLVVIASPQVRLSEEEAFVLQGYLSDRRGSILLMLDPVRGLEDHGLTSLLRLWGLSCDDMRLVEPSVEETNLAPYATLSYNRAEPHPIVSYLAKHDIPLWLFPQASRGRPVFTRTGQASERVTATTLLTSSQASWAEHDWRLPGIADDPKRRSDALNEAGPVPFAAIVERKVRSKHGIDIPGGKLIAVGNSSLFCNLGLSQNGNRTLFSNATHWLLDENEFLDVPPKPLRHYEMSLSSEEYRSLLYHLALVPGIVALIGFSRRVLRRDS